MVQIHQLFGAGAHESVVQVPPTIQSCEDPVEVLAIVDDFSLNSLNQARLNLPLLTTLPPCVDPERKEYSGNEKGDLRDASSSPL